MKLRPVRAQAPRSRGPLGSRRGTLVAALLAVAVLSWPAEAGDRDSLPSPGMTAPRAALPSAPAPAPIQRVQSGSPPAAPCMCRTPSGEVPVGGTTCLRTAEGYRRALCGMVLNNTAWIVGSEPCEASAAAPRSRVPPAG